MSAGKEIRNQIKSVKNTQKITRAMQMVATSKMRKAQDRMRAARPYAEKIREVMAHLAQINPTAKASCSFLRDQKDFKNVGIILITTDKGLCGGLNANSAKLFFEKEKQFMGQNVNVEVCAIGQKGLVSAKRVKANVTAAVTGLGDTPSIEKIVAPISGMFKKFASCELDAVYVIYAHFINTMKQEAKCEQLLPLSDHHLKLEKKLPWDYLYEPELTVVLDGLVQRYVESVVFQCLADNMASEQAARMIAMRAATDNAGEAIHELSLAYNKSRQATITKELSEIVSGAAAV